tara:strand:+ start:383 stop:1471 length:1089 start_codon:yes stop_codon:yes gene_type:complete
MRTKVIKSDISNLKLIAVVCFCFVACSSPQNEYNSRLKPYFGDSESDYYIADDVAGHIHKPNAKREFKWDEHPLGKIVQKTNNFGFRENSNTNLKKNIDVVRVLVTGDSHTDGVLYNTESFPNLMEKMFNEKIETRQTFDFINAAAGYYGPQNYFGVLKRFANLKPNMFIVTIYTGNDFLDAIRIEAENGRLNVPERKDDYYYDLWEVDEKHRGFTGQLMNQIKFFKTFPEYKRKSISLCEDYLTHIKNTCYKKGIQLYVVLLPTKLDIEAELDKERIEEVKKILKFSDEDLNINQLLTTQLVNTLKKHNITCFNLNDFWKEKSMEELYWRNDYHINHNGHKRIADYLMSRITLESKFYNKE